MVTPLSQGIDSLNSLAHQEDPLAKIRNLNDDDKKAYSRNYEKLFETLPKELYPEAFAILFNTEDLKSLSFARLASYFFSMLQIPDRLDRKKIKLELADWFLTSGILSDEGALFFLRFILVNSPSVSTKEAELSYEILQSAVDKNLSCCYAPALIEKALNIKKLSMDLRIQLLSGVEDINAIRHLLFSYQGDLAEQKELLRFAIERKGLDIKSPYQGKFPCNFAQEANRAEFIELYRAYDPENCCETELHRAAAMGNLSRVQELLDSAKGSIYDQNVEGKTPLHVAAKAGHFEIVELLLSHLADEYFPQDFDGKTPLHAALLGGHIDVVDLLTSQGLFGPSPEKSFLYYTLVSLYGETCSLDHPPQWEGYLKYSIEKNVQSPDDFMIDCLSYQSLPLLKALHARGELQALQPHQLHDLFHKGETLEGFQCLRWLTEEGLLGGSPFSILNTCILTKSYRSLFYLIDKGFLEISEYGKEEIPKELSTLLINAEINLNDVLLTDFFAAAPYRFYYKLFQDKQMMLTAGSKNRSLRAALQGRVGFDQAQAEAFIRKVKELVMPQTGVLPAFYRAIFLPKLKSTQAEKLLKFLEDLQQTDGIIIHRDIFKSVILSEFFYHIFTKFRPEFLEGDLEQLDPLLDCWRLAKTNQEKALFFNALQAQSPIEEIARAIRGSRFAFTDLEGVSDEEIIDILAYIEVARCQAGKAYAQRAFRLSRPEIQCRALRALTSLRVPLRPEFVEELETLFAKKDLNREMRAELLRLFWAINPDPANPSLKGKLMQSFENQPKGELLFAAIELLESLDLSSGEIDSIWPTLESISQSKDVEIRTRCAHAFSRINHEEALLRATEIVQSSDWARYDLIYGEEKKPHAGHWLMFTRRPDFHETRSSMITRILDRLAYLKKHEIADEVQKAYQNANLKEFEKGLLRNMDGSEGQDRYYGTPIYFPKGVLLRGLKARKGDEMLDESIRDLIRHGSDRADLSLFRKFDFGTWCKVGHMFGTHSEKGVDFYNYDYENQTTGITVHFRSRFYNKEAMKGFGRLEHEVSLNNVLYRGIPQREIEKIELSEDFRIDFEALNGEDSLEDIKWKRSTFQKLKVEELEELRFYLRPIFHKFVFGSPKPLENPIELDAIKRKTLKRHLQREEVKKLYPKETFAMQDDILETFSDEEYESILPRIEDIFHVTATRAPHTESLSPYLRKIARLAALFSSAPVNLHALRPLHGASPEEMRLVVALIQGISYSELYEKMGYHLCTREEYDMVRKGDQDV